MVALQFPGMETTGWQVRGKRDRVAVAVALANRHYSRQTPSPQVGPPGRLLVLVSPCERAAWVSSHPQHALDGLDAWRCSLFRNEGAGLSSSLIRAAMATTLERWGDRLPADGWLTYVDTVAVASPNPGWCFKVAGWRVDRDWRRRGHKPDRLVRLRCGV